MLSTSIDIKRLTYDLIDVLKDVIIYKNTQDISILFVLTQKDVENLIPYISVEESFEIIDILVDASNHYNYSLNADTYFELALLKICNKIKDENKILVKTDNIIENTPTLESNIVENKEDKKIKQIKKIKI